MTSTSPTRGLICNIQALRAFAALAVVWYHATTGGGIHLPAGTGEFGVDIFFVISGFIISSIAEDDPGQFLAKRLIRIVPSYWVATLGVFVIAKVAPSLVRTTSADWLTLAASLSFIPYDAFDSTSTVGRQILLPGWTLNYEMYFYVMFTLAMFISRKWASTLCAGGILLVMTVVHASGATSVTAAFYGRTILIEFLYGIILFYLLHGAKHVDRHAKKAATGLAAILGLGLIALAMLVSQSHPDLTPTKFLTTGLPAAAVAGSAILLELRYGIAARSRWVLMLGEASYVLYLTHLYVISFVMRLVFQNANSWPEALKWALAILLVASSVPVAVALHFYAERPALNFLRRKFLRRPPPVIFAVGEATALK